MKKSIYAAIAASVLFCAAFAVATGVENDVKQAIPACILMAASAALFRYAERKSSATGTGTLTGTAERHPIRRAA